MVIARKIEALSFDHAQFLTLSYLDPSPDVQLADEELITALNFLCSAPGSPLGSHGYLTIDGEVEVLDDEDFRYALRTGDLVDPITGELEPGGLRRVRLFYVLNVDREATGHAHHE
ncbi:MAG: hypothetical protein IE937_09645 [Gammaproteobacteria bacterium]|nr:hypothetical protein [Gammaproteobacteria bacterium]